MRIEQRQPTQHLGLDDDLLDRVFSARGINDPSQLERGLVNLLSPADLPEIDIAAARLADAVEQNQKILIVGDFDADGATSVALCLLALRAMGATNVDFLVPNRFDYGYGLSPEIVQLAATLAPNVIVTVDNGVASVDGVALANEMGIDVVVTDHHLPGDVLPDAHALVNPNVGDNAFASKSMAGVGVAYYLLSWVRQTLRQRDYFASRQIPEPNMAQYLDLVALGTVADVVPLDQNNRILVHQGLLRIRRGKTRPGIAALARVGKRDLSTLSASDMGFALGPRLNAAGRLQDMSVGIRCLVTDDPAEAGQLAAELDSLNQTRREIEQGMVADAEMILTQITPAPDEMGIAVYHESFHQGVVGIVAGRLREKFHRPAIVFADASDASDELKGSARSIDGLNIRDVLDSIATRLPGMLPKFGGHAMAAGLSIKRVHLARFQKAFDKAVRAAVTQDMLDAVLLTDGSLKQEQLNLQTVATLADAGPWGNGFAEPLFAGEFKLVNQRVVGQDHLKLVLGLNDQLIDAIAFRQKPLGGQPEHVNVVYKPALNDYAGQQTLQLMVEYIEAMS
ncbi:MAG: single-stranded-DNA-specific exonuclease RecJ [Gammaproteobacteria bacterium TMED243]|jgi:single-stranded-DNA-specific exonuclease|nr:single-stranded-DNA-specific exonuclease RecJ [Gammaproteobacteria bacterium]RPG29567.1 MAG: single-stranded-DNA-specific exonuclease RecJ [Gammaproteobacteria bacterium TMED243]